jgi:hypothetical protein
MCPSSILKKMLLGLLKHPIVVVSLPHIFIFYIFKKQLGNGYQAAIFQ